MKAGAEYSVVFVATASLVCLLACFSPDPRSVDGALAYAARAAEDRDARRLFRILDQDARHALDGTLKLRQETAGVIRDNYPPVEAEAALRELGDTLDVPSSEALFEKRCNSECMDWFGHNVGAAQEQRVQGDTVAIRTIRDTQIALRRRGDGWYGIVWKTDEMIAERDRAARDLSQVQENARVYSARKRLEPAN